MIKHDLQRYKGMIATVTGELEVAMLHYDEKERTFSMKVLRGRNLAPRDLRPGPLIRMSSSLHLQTGTTRANKDQES